MPNIKRTRETRRKPGMSRRDALSAAFALAVASVARDASAQPSTSSPSLPAQLAPLLFAVELRIGPKWDPSRRPAEQAYFREHSANLKRLRENGQLLFGARYSDKGLLLLGVDSEAIARAAIEDDPSVQNGIFSFTIHPLNVFHPGCIPAGRRT